MSDMHAICKSVEMISYDFVGVSSCDLIWKSTIRTSSYGTGTGRTRRSYKPSDRTSTYKAYRKGGYKFKIYRYYMAYRY